MLAIGRALMAQPRLLLLDEPSMGLAPQFITQIFRVIEEINTEGVTVLLVEQNATQALGLAHQAYVLETGEVTRSGPGSELLADPSIQDAYLGGLVGGLARRSAEWACRGRLAEPSAVHSTPAAVCVRSREWASTVAPGAPAVHSASCRQVGGVLAR